MAGIITPAVVGIKLLSAERTTPSGTMVVVYTPSLRVVLVLSVNAPLVVVLVIVAAAAPTVLDRVKVRRHAAGAAMMTGVPAICATRHAPNASVGDNHAFAV